MSREWKTGAVAIGRVGCHAAPLERLVKCEDGDWVRLGAHSRAEDCLVEDLRPLVVIDPEDREQVERFTYLFLSHYWSDTEAQTHTDAGQAALREFANPTPPKPEEPQGLGAVVEDERGVRWIRWWAEGYEDHPCKDRCWSGANGLGSDRAYADISAVRVLSEGVPS